MLFPTKYRLLLSLGTLVYTMQNVPREETLVKTMQSTQRLEKRIGSLSMEDQSSREISLDSNSWRFIGSQAMSTGTS
jgi:hypothetical protein